MFLMLATLGMKAQFLCTANFTYSASPSGIVTFSGISSGSPTQTFTWTFGNGTSGTGTPVTCFYNSPGNYTVCLYVLDTAASSPCIDSNCVTITVGTSACHASYTSSVDTSVGALPNTFNFFNTSTGSSLSYVWDFGDGTGSTLANPNHTYATPGVYTACLYIDNGSGCLDTTCSSINTTTATCDAQFNAVPDNSPTALPYSFFFINNSVGATSYIWNFGDGSPNSTSANPYHTFPGVGVYNVCLSIFNSATSCFDSLCTTVTVTPFGACNAGFYLYPDTSVGSAPHTFIGINTSTGSLLTYTWSWGDGTSSTGPYPSHSYASAGLYTICLTVSGAGCVDSFCSTQMLNKTGGMVTVNIQAPSAVRQVETKQINVFPNPASDILFLEGMPALSCKAEIFTLNGTKVFSTTLKGSTSLNIQKLPSQFYTLKVTDEEGKTYFAKFMKQ